MTTSNHVEKSEVLASPRFWLRLTSAIRPHPVERDKDGYWTHPNYPEHWDEGTTSSEITGWFTEQGLESQVAEFEFDAPDELQDMWMETGEPSCNLWNPTYPDGRGWFMFSIHDTERGPVCVWVRPTALSAEEDEGCVDRFAEAMKIKLATARSKGYACWHSPDACSSQQLAELLVLQLNKRNAGTFEDIANFAMMLHQRDEEPSILADVFRCMLPGLLAQLRPQAPSLLRTLCQLRTTGTTGPSVGYWFGLLVGHAASLAQLNLITGEQFNRLFDLIENARDYAGRPFPSARKEAI